MPTALADRWRARPPRARVADLALGGFIALLAVAIVVNAIADVRNAKRMKVDKKVVKAWERSHPQLGHFYTPSIKVHRHTDLACAYLKPPQRHVRASEGYCLEIDSRTIKSKRILASYHCTIGAVPASHPSRKPKAPPLAPGDRYCPLKRLVKAKKK